MQAEKEQSILQRHETFLKRREELARQIKEAIMSHEAQKIKEDLK